MVLSEGRKEDVYNKFKKEIDNERILHSDVTTKSFYDFLVMDNFIIETNYKYLEPLVKQYYGWYVSVDGNAEPLRRDIAIQSLSATNGVYNRLVELVEYYHNNPSKYDKKDLKDYVGDDFESDFVNYTIKLREEKTNKEVRNAIKNETKRIFENDKVLIVKPLSFESSCYYGAGTKWCSTSKDDPSYYNDYTSKGGLYYIILKNVPAENKFYKIGLFLAYGTVDVALGEWVDSKSVSLTPGELEMFMALIPDEAFRLIEKDNTVNLIELFSKQITNSIENFKFFDWGYLYKMYDYFIKYFSKFTFVSWIEETDHIALQYKFDIRVTEIAINRYPKTLVDKEYKKYPHSSGYLNIFIFPSENGNTIGVTNDVDEVRGDDILGTITRNWRTKDFFSNTTLSNKIEQFIIDCVYFSITQRLNKKNLEIVEKLGWTPRYGKHTFTKGSETIIEFFKYMDSLPEGVKGSKGDFFVKSGKLEKRGNQYFLKGTSEPRTIRGYYSATFSALRAAGILDPNVKQGFVKGPNYEKYKQRLLSNQKTTQK